MITAEKAAEFGAEDGAADVENVLAEQGAEAVAATLAPGHLGWDEGAIFGAAHTHRGIGDSDSDLPLRSAYYEAYAASALARAREVVES